MDDHTSPFAALDGHYHLHFAGRPRATRDLAMLDALLAEAMRLDELVSDAGDRLDRWRRERDEIASAQDTLGERGVGAMRACERIAMPASRVRRLARTQQQTLCAPAELKALHQEAAQALTELDQLPSDVATNKELTATIARTRAELAQATAALTRWQQEPIAEGDRIAVNAGRAQRLFALFGACVEGRSQLVVRPDLLNVWADALDESRRVLERDELGDIDAAVHRGNMEAMAQQAAHWRTQAQMARDQRHGCDAKEVMHALLEEADVILEAAQAPLSAGEGQIAPRVSSQTEHAGVLAWRMDEVCRQLDAIPSVFGLGGDERATWGLFDCVVFLDDQLAQQTGAPQR